MSVEIYKGTITFTVMGSAGTAEEFERMLQGMSLAQIIEDADSEGLIRGDHKIEQVEHIHRDDVSDELQAVGNDGSFFDCELEEEEEEDER